MKGVSVARNPAALAACATVAVALAGVPLAWIPAEGADAWSELFRHGVAAGLAVIGTAAISLSGHGAALRAQALVRPLAALGAALLLASALAPAPVLGLVETARLLSLALYAPLAALAGAWLGERGPWLVRAAMVAPFVALLCGTAGNRNDLGTLGAMGVVLALARASRSRADLALGLLPLATLAASGTRAAWLAAGVVGLGLAIARGTSRRARLAGLLLGLLLVAGAFALRALPRDAAPLQESAAGRVALWRAAFALFVDDPLTGRGPGAFRAEAALHLAGSTPLQSLSAHNDPLELLAESGVLGLAAAAWLLLAAWRAARAAARDASPWAWAFAAAFLHSLVHLVLRAPGPAVYSWIALGLAVSSSTAAPAAAAPPRALRLLWLTPLWALALLVALAPAGAAVAMRRMEAAFRAQDWDAVPVEARRALRFDPTRPEVHARLAALHLMAKDWPAAAEAARIGLSFAPGDARLHLRLGQASHFLGQREAALRELELARRLDPGNRETAEWLARAAQPRGTP